MSKRYPDYDVLRKRQGPSWNEPSRQVVDRRLAVPREAAFFSPTQLRTLQALCARIVPQPTDRPPVPVAALVQMKVGDNRGDGYRDARLPPLQQAWTLGLDALDSEAHQRHRRPFADLPPQAQDALISAMQRGELKSDAWQDMPAAAFFSHRLVHDISTAYYSHPTAWNELGFGGPASPRGYVRLAEDSRDSWEAAEAHAGNEARARELNRHVR
ncbi:gluconate 2-dehydrogenase subunit 3 family protein [Stutzerimonas stutzeri]|uniref:gluconate 2-dehydrogenase subunit 3 family protein n=1 Tax=Stutzerimonas stutzeri TaxID=316 RepID=UPI001C2E6293|nr:gluconate 2-dehydrogenase subunit 3 family protein [Stutzerimonas stutzeri]